MQFNLLKNKFYHFLWEISNANMTDKWRAKSNFVFKALQKVVILFLIKKSFQLAMVE